MTFFQNFLNVFLEVIQLLIELGRLGSSNFQMIKDEFFGFREKNLQFQRLIVLFCLQKS